jgi:hypothetical protein
MELIRGLCNHQFILIKDVIAVGSDLAMVHKVIEPKPSVLILDMSTGVKLSIQIESELPNCQFSPKNLSQKVLNIN